MVEHGTFRTFRKPPDPPPWKKGFSKGYLQKGSVRRPCAPSPRRSERKHWKAFGPEKAGIALRKGRETKKKGGGKPLQAHAKYVF